MYFLVHSNVSFDCGCYWFGGILSSMTTYHEWFQKETSITKKVFSPGIGGVSIHHYVWTETLCGPQNDLFPFAYWKRVGGSWSSHYSLPTFWHPFKGRFIPECRFKNDHLSFPIIELLKDQ